MREQAQILRWGDPPPPARGRRKGTENPAWSRYNTIAAQLRERRGEWALVAEFTDRSDRGLSSKISRGAMNCFTPAGDFEATTRWVGGLARVYARFLGDGEGDE